ncbi:MAG: DedA family protein [Acetobacter sp.]|nr:DedA family protein [Acetobacter sp.]MBR2124300.1 DedA family protein [Acetobacter sp.]
MGFPLPAESLLITSALFCATTHKLPIQNVIIAGIIGAIMGDNFGYLIGRSFGMQILHKHGPKIGLTEQRLLLGNYMFSKYGGVIVFSGRFVAILRMFVALLAGANRMPWHSFLFYNALGGIFWAGGYTTCAYFLGTKIERLSGYLAIIFGGITAIIILTLLILFKYHEKRLTKQALDAAKKEAARQSCQPIEEAPCPSPTQTP